MTMPRSRLDGPHTAQTPPNQVTAPQKTYDTRASQILKLYYDMTLAGR